MRMKRIGIWICSILCMISFVGCGQEEVVWKPINEDNTIKIAILGDDEYIYDSGCMEAMELASSDFCKSSGITVDVVIYDDDADYNKGVGLAKEIANDGSIAAVIIKQELDYIDTTAEIFEDAQKPFIIASGCYEHTIDNGYKYMLVACINAETAGDIMADWVIQHGYKMVAFCHSDTEYEEDELKGFQAAIEKSDVCFADAFVGPYTQEEFDIAYARWKALGVDAVCISNYDILNSDLIRMLREKGSDIAVIGDYVMDTEDDIAANGDYMEGTAIVSMYINDNAENNKQILEAYMNTYGFEMSEKAMQSYDLIYMVAQKLVSDISKPLEFIASLKESNGYRGITGTVQFDENGCIVPNGSEILVFHEGAFVQINISTQE